MKFETNILPKQRINSLYQEQQLSTQQELKTKPYPNDSVELSIKKQDKPQANVSFAERLIKYFVDLFANKSTNSVTNNTFIEIEPKRFCVIQDSVPMLKKDIVYNYIDSDNARIKKSCKPITIPKVNLSKDKKILNVSNFVAPFGTISASTPLNESIVTGKLLQCAGVAIVDKSKNVQTLVHCYAGNSKEELAELFKHILEQSNPKDLDITVITGTYDVCDNTITGITEALKEQLPKNKIKLANFSKDSKIFDRAVILENGKLSCCSNTEIEENTNKETNPMDKISYIDFDR